LNPPAIAWKQPDWKRKYWCGDVLAEVGPNVSRQTDYQSTTLQTKNLGVITYGKYNVENSWILKSKFRVRYNPALSGIIFHTIFDTKHSLRPLLCLRYLSPENTKLINEELAKHNWKTELNGVLTQLPPFVFVRGEFRVYSSSTPFLVHDFVGQDGNFGVKGEQFRPVTFILKFPLPGLPPDLKDRRTIQGTVFGSVVHGLDSEGVVEVRLIAIY
jgi:hypothetical protein